MKNRAIKKWLHRQLRQTRNPVNHNPNHFVAFQSWFCILIQHMFAWLCLLTYLYFVITSFEMFVPFVATLKTDYVIFSMTTMSSKQSNMQKTERVCCWVHVDCFTSVLSIVFKRGQIKLKYTVRLIELDKYA